MKKLVILDRDGVINYDSDEFIKSPHEWIPYPKSLTALRLLKEAGFICVVATNQSGIGRGLFDEATLTQIHEKMHATVENAGGAIDRVFYCPHLPEDACMCRKPNPGLLWQIQDYYQISLTHVPFIGDSWRDIEAGRKAGCIPILIKTGKGEKSHQENINNLDNVMIFDNLLLAASYLCED